MTGAGPTRVLNVLASLGVGGIETYLMNLLRARDQAEFQIDFLLNRDGRRWFDDEAEILGATIHRGPSPRNPVAYTQHLRRLLTAERYDVVHSHLYTYSGIVLRVAHRAGVRVRIAHTHTYRIEMESAVRRAYRMMMRGLIARHATHGFAPTDAAGSGLFGPRWRTDDRFRIMPMGFDFSAFANPPDQRSARADIGVPQDLRILSHIGGFSAQKNHAFLFDVFGALAARRPDVHLVLLTRDHAAAEAERARRGLAHACTVVDTATPAATVLAAADLFLLPSKWEGLPVVVLEAQAIGTAVLGSRAVPDEAVVLPELVARLDLDAGREAWADAADRLLDDAPAGLGIDAMYAVEDRFGIERAWHDLSRVYCSP